jgi:hypothetical protein
MTKSMASALALGCLTCALCVPPVTIAHAGCVWRGTAPFCEGECKPGERTSHRSSEFIIKGEPPFGEPCVTGSKALCCTAPASEAAPAPETPSRGHDWMKYKDKQKEAAPAPAQPQGSPKPTKPLGKRPMACANNDVDVYNSPTEPRNVTGTMSSEAKAAILQRHPDGWWKLEGYGWVAQDHLRKC